VLSCGVVMVQWFSGGGTGLSSFAVLGPCRHEWVVVLGPRHCSLVMVLGPGAWWYGPSFAICQWWYWALVTIRGWWCGASFSIRAWWCWVLVCCSWCWVLVAVRATWQGSSFAIHATGPLLCYSWVVVVPLVGFCVPWCMGPPHCGPCRHWRVRVVGRCLFAGTCHCSWVPVGSRWWMAVAFVGLVGDDEATVAR